MRAKTLRIALALEQYLGIPVRHARRPSPLDMLVATILSQNTNDKNSHRAYLTLRKRFPEWEDVAAAPRRSIISAIRVGGMAQQKSARIKTILTGIKIRFGDFRLRSLKRMSDEEVFDELTKFKGVGAKTAACVLLFSLAREVFPVDTHVHRICNRLGLTNGSKLPERTYELMKPLVPKGKAYSLHTNLIRFGRSVCRSNNPACDTCPVFKECVYEGKMLRGRVMRPLSGAKRDFMLLDNV